MVTETVGVGVMENMRALVVEDDPDISAVLVATLEAAGFEVTAAPDGTTAVDSARTNPPDLVTLDLTLPQMDGIEVCRHIREVSDCYIVIVSARTDEIDRLIGLEVGADDFILKPFSPRELRARVAALFRRPRSGSSAAATMPSDPSGARVPAPGTRTPAQPVIDCGDGLLIHPARREVEVNGAIVDLTRIEYDVLAFLAERLAMVCTREQMVKAIWSSDLDHDHHLVDVHVANLRGKLRKHSSTPWIHTVRGIGYRLDVAGGGRNGGATGGVPPWNGRLD
jgi:DNA-binding response OmpR family regulator